MLKIIFTKLLFFITFFVGVVVQATDFDPIKFDALVKGKTNTQVGEITANLYKDQDLWKKTVVLRSVGFENITNGGKHYPATNLTKAQIIKNTLNKQPAKYFDVKTISKIEKEAFDFGVKSASSSDEAGKIYYKAKEIVGASGGKETKYLRVDYSAKTYHEHPMTYEELLVEVPTIAPRIK